MKAKDIDITQFENLHQLYEFVDEHAFELERNWDLSDVFVKYRSHTTSDEEKQKSQWEVECFIFDVKGNRFFSLSSSNGKSIGEVKEYPSLDDFQKEAFNYIKQRTSSCKNQLLKARYNHLLWKGPSGIKDQKFALGAIPNYIFSIQKYYDLHLRQTERENSLQIARLFETLVSLSNEVNKGTDDVKKLASFLLFETDLPFYCKHAIIDDMLKFPKIFKADDFKKTLSIYENELKKDNISKSDDFLQVTSYLPKAIKVAQKLGDDVKIWHNEIGNAYLRIANSETEEERMWLKQNNYVKAIQAFGMAANPKSKQETEQLYFELKTKVKLTNVPLTPSKETIERLEEFQEYIKGMAENILKSKPLEIYSYISNGSFFPKYKSVVEASKGSENSFLDFVTTVHFDKNKNIKQSGTTSSQDEHFYFIYSQQINYSVLPLLHFTLVPGIKSGHLTFENFLSYLIQHSWIGKPYSYIDLGGEENEINLVNILTPSIVEYFSQVQAWTASKFYQPSFLLCTDSLTLKFETLLRNFCERLNIGTSIGRQKGMQEAYIHNVLENEDFKKYFNEDDIVFFKFLFSSEGGLNIRNNVAHSFYDYREYTSDKMLLLIAALLRIAKYDIKKTDNLD